MYSSEVDCYHKRETRGGVLDRIELVTHDWFYLSKTNELYYHVDGNFEAYLGSSLGLQEDILINAIK